MKEREDGERGGEKAIILNISIKGGAIIRLLFEEMWQLYGFKFPTLYTFLIVHYSQ